LPFNQINYADVARPMSTTFKLSAEREVDFFPHEVLELMPQRNAFLTERGIHYYDKLVLATGLE